jgi:hypothetical protein
MSQQLHGRGVNPRSPAKSTLGHERTLVVRLAVFLFTIFILPFVVAHPFLLGEGLIHNYNNDDSYFLDRLSILLSAENYLTSYDLIPLSMLAVLGRLLILRRKIRDGFSKEIPRIF